MKKTNRFTPITIKEGEENELTFNNDQEYYEYFSKKKEKKCYMVINGIEIEMQTDSTITL